MISLDQVLLLEERVESAVAKIAQLNAENAALRRKCAELTNALSAKTEQLSSFQSDQNKIEEGILKALNRLDVVENAVLSASSSAEPSVSAVPSVQPSPAAQAEPSEPQNSEPMVSENANTEAVVPEPSVSEVPVSNPEPAFDQLQQVSSTPITSSDVSSIDDIVNVSGNTENSTETSSDTSTQSLFDIF